MKYTRKENITAEITRIKVYSGEVKSKELYLGKTDLLGVSDFAEYDFKYIVDKIGYSSDLNLNELSEISTNFLSNFLSEEIELISNNILFTNSTDNLGSTGFFSILKVLGQTLYLIPLEENVSKVEFLDKDETIHSEVEFEGDNEVLPKKVLWMVMCDSEVTSINLSYQAWKTNNEPHRNKQNFNLRNIKKINPIKQVGKLLMDKRSGSLLSMGKESTNHPILDKKLNQFNNIKNSWREVKEGEKIGDSYISLFKNRHNIPEISTNWSWSQNDEQYLGKSSNIFCKHANLSQSTVNSDNTTIYIYPTNPDYNYIPGKSIVSGCTVDLTNSSKNKLVISTVGSGNIFIDLVKDNSSWDRFTIEGGDNLKIKSNDLNNTIDLVDSTTEEFTRRFVMTQIRTSSDEILLDDIYEESCKLPYANNSNITVSVEPCNTIKIESFKGYEISDLDEYLYITQSHNASFDFYKTSGKSGWKIKVGDDIYVSGIDETRLKENLGITITEESGIYTATIITKEQNFSIELVL